VGEGPGERMSPSTPSSADQPYSHSFADSVELVYIEMSSIKTTWIFDHGFGNRNG
jgi:hypothetical protein